MLSKAFTDVDHALRLWQAHMERKGQTTSGAMLQEKRKRLEELFDVPEEERLKGNGWLTLFKQSALTIHILIADNLLNAAWVTVRHGIKQQHCHGGAGSRCFKKHSLAALNVQYKNNKKTWMTKVLFEP